MDAHNYGTFTSLVPGSRDSKSATAMDIDLEQDNSESTRCNKIKETNAGYMQANLFSAMPDVRRSNQIYYVVS